MSYDSQYAPPAARSGSSANTKEVALSKEAVWNALVSGLGSRFFVINNMDKASGFINVSYSGDPEKYIDGGELYFKFENMRGPREYRFPASKAQMQYELLNGGVLVMVDRRLSLEGRVNIIVTEPGEGRSLLTVNTRYVLTLNVTGRNIMGQPIPPFSETISFNTGGEAKLAAGTTFRPTGALEEAVLSLVK